MVKLATHNPYTSKVHFSNGPYTNKKGTFSKVTFRNAPSSQVSRDPEPRPRSTGRMGVDVAAAVMHLDFSRARTPLAPAFDEAPLAKAPGTYQRQVLGRALGEAHAVLERHNALRDRPSARLQKAMDRITPNKVGTDQAHNHVLTHFTNLGAIRAGLAAQLESLAADDPLPAHAIQDVSVRLEQVDAAIVATARVLGSCKDGHVFGLDIDKADSTNIASAVFAGEAAVYKALQGQDWQGHLTGMANALMLDPLLNVIKKRLSPELRDALASNQVDPASLMEVLDPFSLEAMCEGIGNAGNKGTPEGMMSALGNWLALPEFIEQPQTGKPADDAPKADKVPADAPQWIKDAARNGSPILYNNNVNDVAQANKAETAEQAFQRGYMQAKLESVENRLADAVDRIANLERANRDLQWQFAWMQNNLNSVFGGGARRGMSMNGPGLVFGPGNVQMTSTEYLAMTRTDDDKSKVGATSELVTSDTEVVSDITDDNNKVKQPLELKFAACTFETDVLDQTTVPFPDLPEQVTITLEDNQMQNTAHLDVIAEDEALERTLNGPSRKTVAELIEKFERKTDATSLHQNRTVDSTLKTHTTSVIPEGRVDDLVIEKPRAQNVVDRTVFRQWSRTSSTSSGTQPVVDLKTYFDRVQQFPIQRREDRAAERFVQMQKNAVADAGDPTAVKVERRPASLAALNFGALVSPKDLIQFQVEQANGQWIPPMGGPSFDVGTERYELLELNKRIEARDAAKRAGSDQGAFKIRQAIEEINAELKNPIPGQRIDGPTFGRAQAWADSVDVSEPLHTEVEVDGHDVESNPARRVSFDSVAQWVDSQPRMTEQEKVDSGLFHRNGLTSEDVEQVSPGDTYVVERLAHFTSLLNALEPPKDSVKRDPRLDVFFQNGPELEPESLPSRNDDGSLRMLSEDFRPGRRSVGSSSASSVATSASWDDGLDEMELFSPEAMQRDGFNWPPLPERTHHGAPDQSARLSKHNQLPVMPAPPYVNVP